MPISSPTTPEWVAAHAKRIIAAREDPRRLLAAIESSAEPTLLLDDERRYIEANSPARSVLQMSLEELRKLRLDDLTPRHLLSVLESNWTRMMRTGRVVSTEVARPEGPFLGVSYYFLANTLPGQHILAFLPPWPGGKTATARREAPGSGPRDGLLTPRETEVLELASRGLKGPAIAQELVLTPATVGTHFANIYRKLDVGDRAAAVAKAMRLGLIR